MNTEAPTPKLRKHENFVFALLKNSKIVDLDTFAFYQSILYFLKKLPTTILQ
jgi:hypothetical protein